MYRVTWHLLSVQYSEIRHAVTEVKKLTKALLAQADLLSDSENLSKAEQLKEMGRNGLTQCWH